MKDCLGLVSLILPALATNLSAQARPSVGLVGPSMRSLLDQDGGKTEALPAGSVRGKIVGEGQGAAAAGPAKKGAGLTIYAKTEGIDATKGEVSAEGTLRQAGITVSNVTAGTRIVVVDARNEYAGQAVVPPSSADPNLVTQKGANGLISFTLNFSKPVCGFEFTRPALIAGPNGISHPAWMVSAFGQADARGDAIDAPAGEDMIRYGAWSKDFKQGRPYPAQAFTLKAKDAGTPIASVRIDSNGDLNGKPFAAFNGVLLSNITVDYCAP